MSSLTSSTRPIENQLVFWAWAGAWAAYAIGGLYIVGPILGVTLAALVCWRIYASPILLTAERAASIPITIWIWIIAMVVMLVSLIVGHFSEGLGLAKTIKSIIGWAKGWFLLALFPLAGACLNIRLDTIVRANGYLALQMLILTPILMTAGIFGLPDKLFISPLKILGGAGAEYFTFFLYAPDPEDGSARLQYIAPWAPAAGFVANIMLVIACEDKRKFWRILGILAAITMVLLCKSRMALLCMMVSWPLAFSISKLSRGWPMFLAGVASLFGGLFAAPIIDTLTATLDKVNGMRAGSNRVRGALNDMAFDRWWTEARVWGHGIVERGPHHVEYMPIGSHHTWLGLLFVKGAIGFLAMMVAMIWTTLDLAITSQNRTTARGGLAIIFVMWFFSFSENLEMLAYLYWPGLVLIGISLRVDGTTDAASSKCKQTAS